jgi:primosomal protein N' (replication factor Y)
MAACMSARPRIVRVAVPKPLPQLFDYALGADDPLPVPGARLWVPFGKQRLVGVCVDPAPADPHMDARPIESILDSENLLGENLYDLGHWLADYYHHPIGEVLSALLPASLRRGGALGDGLTPIGGWQLTPAAEVTNLARAPRQRALIQHLQSIGGAASTAELAAAGFDATHVRAAAAKGLVVRIALTGPRAKLQINNRPVLTAEQASALEALRANQTGFRITLLEGVTGSGKTEVYLRLIEAMLAAGRQSLVLVPEIALTPQTLSRFRARFGVAAALHSGLTDAQRLQVWAGCRDGTVDILVGTRSAVLTPFRDLGLIIVDEEHDSSFKQQDGLRYSGRDVAAKRAKMLGIPLVLGSATPAFESLVNAKTRRYRHLRMTERAGGASAPVLRLIDIRGQPLQDGLSPGMTSAARRHLDAGGQVLLFLNRRGFAPSFVCSGCGWQARCRSCDLAMTLHREPAHLACHHCGARAPVPGRCPNCQRDALVGVGLGTQRAESGIAERFPDVPIYRIDRDSARSAARLERHFAAILGGEPAILIGTQMLAKGHHFPQVSLVGVINADSGFLSADFRAPERTAQLIVQVAGRAGRAERPGEVWIQTYQPENPALVALLEGGYPAFAERELDARRDAGLPPFRAMALVRAESDNAAAALQALADVGDRIARLPTQPNLEAVELLGPVPAPIAKIAHRHRFQLLLLAPTRTGLQRVLRQLELSRTRVAGVRLALDVDPYDAA